MSEFKKLRDAVFNLRESISNFPIGAVSINDFDPIEERIKNTRESLKHLNARLLALKAQNEFNTISREPKEEDVRSTVTSLHEATANSHINNKAIKLCLHSYAINAILTGNEGDKDMQQQVYALMRKLYTLNDSMLLVQTDIEDALQKQLELKIQCQNALYDYKNFLKEQEEIRRKKLQETHPEMARNKDKTSRTLQKINIMKRLIVNFIAASYTMLQKEPFLVEMLEEHRELVNMDTILKMTHSNAENENEEDNAEQ